MSNGKHSASGRHFSKRTKEEKVKTKIKQNKAFDKEQKKSNRNKEKKPIFNKVLIYILTIVIIAIVLAIGYFAYEYFKEHPIDFFNNSNDNNVVSGEGYMEELGEESEKVEATKPLTVIGAEYLEITGVDINSDGSKLSTVSSKLKNLSNKEYENINIRITLFDKDDNEITFLDYKIDKLEANEETSTYASLKRDLSNFGSYSITLIKTKE